jgi:hypothetical protein
MKKIFLFSARILLLVISFGCTKQNANDGWQEFKSDDGGFSVQFPGLPKEEIKNIKPFPAHLFIYKPNETNSYIVIYSDVPPQPDPRGPEKVFDDARVAILGKDRKPLQEISITNNDYVGREMEWEPNYANKNNGEAFTIAHFFVTKKHFYEVLAHMPSADRFSTNYWYFLNSFRLLDPK